MPVSSFLPMVFFLMKPVVDEADLVLAWASGMSDEPCIRLRIKLLAMEHRKSFTKHGMDLRVYDQNPPLPENLTGPRRTVGRRRSRCGCCCC
jgi:hypothetical protein